MGQLAENYDERQEFWKPAVPLRQETPGPEATPQACDSCGSDFLMSARYCHVCGAERNLVAQPAIERRTWLSLSAVREALGQTTASLIALFLGIICIIAAVVTGLIYSATTVLDWQAVQVWRIEWLLAAVAMFALGTLLKKQ